MEDPYSWLGEPEGEYHLYLPGFEKPLAFEMEAAPTLREEQKLSGEVLSKEFISGRDFEKEMSGAEERDGYGLIVRARQEEMCIRDRPSSGTYSYPQPPQT